MKYHFHMVQKSMRHHRLFKFKFWFFFLPETDGSSPRARQVEKGDGLEGGHGEEGEGRRDRCLKLQECPESKRKSLVISPDMKSPAPT